MYLFFDTETTGLPQNWKAPVTDLANWPRMVQLAWLVYDEKGKEINRANYLIQPKGYRIPAGVAMMHGITTERAAKEGIPLEAALAAFAGAIEDAAQLVAHNIEFDERIIGAEFLRTEIPNQLFDKPRLCTMKSSINYCRLPGKYGRYKNPSLTELHQKLFGHKFDDAHDALADVVACARCFFELRELGVM
ncbi:MAG: 3'-5' exonuclease [Bacteroidia bacterium]|nr:3'-5' exonuclease [Bacteroidia bacterium]